MAVRQNSPLTDAIWDVLSSRDVFCDSIDDYEALCALSTDSVAPGQNEHLVAGVGPETA